MKGVTKSASNRLRAKTQAANWTQRAKGAIGHPIREYASAIGWQWSSDSSVPKSHLESV